MSRRSSLVWEYFNRVGQDSVMCSICKKKFKYHNSTSNMKLHLKTKHPYTLTICEESQPDLPKDSSSEVRECEVRPTSSESLPVPVVSALTPNQPLTLTSLPEEPPQKRPRQLKLIARKDSLSDLEKNSINMSLVKMIGFDLQPLSLVENKGFIEYSHKLQPQYIIPSRKYLTNTLIPGVCRDLSLKIKSQLNETENVGITTDIWSSDSNRSFLTVTCHYIFDDAQQNAVLATREIPGSHTGASIAASLTGIFSEWGIGQKIVAIVTDNAANIKSAVNDHLKIVHVPCVAHTLNLCVTDAIDMTAGFKEIIKKARMIVTYFKTSNLAADKLREVQKQMNVPQLRPKQDVATRWNSTLIMIDRLLEIRGVISAAMSHLPKAPDALDANEWLTLVDCTQILQPVQTMTQEISGEKYSTISMVIPLVRSIQFAINNLESETAIGIALKSKLLDVISKRFSGWEQNKTTAKATLLDPRFMKIAFGQKENADKAEKLVIEELQYSIKRQQESNNTAEGSNQNVIETSEDLSEPHQSDRKKDKARQKLWEWVDNRVEETKKTRESSTATSAALIMRHYLELPQPNRWENPLPSCAKNKTVLPEIYRLQKKYLCIPATSVPAERLFSTAGQVTNDRRNKLKPKNMDNILFLHGNLK